MTGDIYDSAEEGKGNLNEPGQFGEGHGGGGRGSDELKGFDVEEFPEADAVDEEGDHEGDGADGDDDEEEGEGGLDAQGSGEEVIVHKVVNLEEETHGQCLGEVGAFASVYFEGLVDFAGDAMKFIEDGYFCQEGEDEAFHRGEEEEGNGGDGDKKEDEGRGQAGDSAIDIEADVDFHGHDNGGEEEHGEHSGDTLHEDDSQGLSGGAVIFGSIVDANDVTANLGGQEHVEEVAHHVVGDKAADGLVDVLCFQQDLPAESRKEKAGEVQGRAQKQPGPENAFKVLEDLCEIDFGCKKITDEQCAEDYFENRTDVAFHSDGSGVLGGFCRVLMTRAGEPAAMPNSGMSLLTTDPAPMMTPFEIWQPSRILTSAPNQMSSSIVIPSTVLPCWMMGRSVRSKLCLPPPMI